jgi:Cu(I)/Ag(I) efflux system membrane fusion protein
MMKTKSIFILFLSLTAVYYMGCGSNTSPQFNPSSAKSSLPEAQTLLAGEILQHYYQLKDALVATSNKDADAAAKMMKGSLLRLKNELNNHKDSAMVTHLQDTAIPQITDSMLIQLDLILSVKDETCEVKRLYFKPLSNLTYRFLKAVDIKNVQVYHQFCPMALNEQSADWLSASPKIENPYFGQKMLTCGELIDTIK